MEGSQTIQKRPFSLSKSSYTLIELINRYEMEDHKFGTYGRTLSEEELKHKKLLSNDHIVYNLYWNNGRNLSGQDRKDPKLWLVDEIICKLYDETDRLSQITDVIAQFLKKYMDNYPTYRFLRHRLKNLFTLYVTKCVQLDLKCHHYFIHLLEKERIEVDLNYGFLLTNNNEIDTHLLKKLLNSGIRYDYLFPRLMFTFHAAKKPFMFKGDIEKMLNKFYEKNVAKLQNKEDYVDRITWFETMGIYVSKTLLILTPEMADIFISVLPKGGWYITGYEKYYAEFIFNELILFLLQYTEFELRINKSALLEMFEVFHRFCSNYEINIPSLTKEEITQLEASLD